MQFPTQIKMERIVFLERNTIQANFRRPNFAHEWIEYGETLPAQVFERLRGATIVISNKLSLRKAELSEAPGLRLIAIAATGSDCVDLDYCRARGIAVCNVRGYAANAVPEHVLMLVLALRRNLLAYREDVQHGKWQLSKQFCLLTHELRDIRGSTLGVVGYGSIGRSLARLGQALDIRVLVAGRKEGEIGCDGWTSFEEVLRQSDIITLHCSF